MGTPYFYFVCYSKIIQEFLLFVIFKNFFTLSKVFTDGKIDYNDEIFISNERNKAALDNAKESFRLVRRSINDGMPEDFYTIDLMNAYEELGKIIGESVEDDLVNEIFGKFCMGK